MTDYKTFKNPPEGGAPKTRTSSGNWKFSLSWLNLTYKVKVKGGYKTLLDGLNGHVEPGGMLAIMGPSGCGKTTLMNLLADRVSSGIIEGEILVDGSPRTSDFRYQASYVAQENALMDVFTVRETIEFTADLALPSSTPTSEKRTRVNEIIDLMGLRSCEDTRVGGLLFKGISGGQAKRLSMALSLITDPCIIMLDEPTSGLDSSATINVMQAIKDLADQSKTVLYSIHQPSSEVFAMFDSLLLLTGGQTIYYGKASESVDFFTQQGFQCPAYSNPADYFLTVVNTDFDGHGDINALAEAYELSPNNDDVKRLIQKAKENQTGGPKGFIKHKANWFAQCYYLAKRLTINSLLNPAIIWVRFIMYILVSVTIGGLFFDFDEDSATADDSIAALLFFCQTFFIFLSFGALPYFITQRPVFVRERSNGLIDVLPFVIGNFISIIPPIAVFATEATGITYLMVGLNGYKWYLLTIFLVLIIAESVINIVSAITTDYVVAIVVCANYNGLMSLSQGFLVPYSDMPVFFKIFNKIGYTKYGYESLMYNHFSREPNGTEVLIGYEMEDVVLEDYALLFLAFIFAHQFIFFLLIFFLHTGKQ
ncbi:uncharacterized protein LOC142340748 [Convolutriloba macropyga]|uniref:uncharacterized protein LOC142340748 n=1 Tax=Convolutriloba macropyga TaxID=536237 RepID=UPI003F51BDC6